MQRLEGCLILLLASSRLLVIHKLPFESLATSFDFIAHNRQKELIYVGYFASKEDPDVP